MDLVGNKVILRRIEQQDMEMLRGLIDDPETVKVTGGYIRPASYGHQIQWFSCFTDSAGGLRCIIADKEHPETGLGIILLSIEALKSTTGEIYIKLLKSVRNRGYGQDAVTVMVSYGFCQLGLDRICSNIVENNKASRRLFEKCGFIEEGVRKSRSFGEGEDRNVLSYIIERK